MRLKNYLNLFDNIIDLAILLLTTRVVENNEGWQSRRIEILKDSQSLGERTRGKKNRGYPTLVQPCVDSIRFDFVYLYICTSCLCM